MFGIGVYEIAVILIVFIVPTVFYLRTLQRTLELCSPESRTMAPASVWFFLIPVFNLVWHFVIVIRVAQSLENEFLKRGVREPIPGRNIGLAACILFILSAVVGPAGIAGLVCLIIYWVRIARFSARLRNANEPVAASSVVPE